VGSKGDSLWQRPGRDDQRPPQGRVDPSPCAVEDQGGVEFQLHIFDADTGEIQWRQIKRARLTEFFVKCVPSLVAMEACGASCWG